MASAGGIVDTHLHLWDPRRLTYPWHQFMPEHLARPYLIDDFRVASAGLDIDAMVFIECFAQSGQSEPEVRFIEEQVAHDPRIKAIVMYAAVEEGEALTPYLEYMRATTPLLRGVRRALNFERDPEYIVSPAFIEGVRLLERFDLSFEISVGSAQLPYVARFAEQVPGVRLVLDHCGKPAISKNDLASWSAQIRDIAGHPNVTCKLSDLPSEIGRQWTEAQIRPYIDAVVDAFGFERLIYGGDWPVCTIAMDLPEWKTALDRCFAGVDGVALDRFYRNNAIDLYRLDLPPA